MAASGLLRRVALVITDVSEEHRASFISMTRIVELGTTFAVTSNRRTTPVDPLEFPFMSFGLRNAAQAFQRFMDGILRGLDFCFDYLDGC
jgi:hypothetical protein